MVEFNSSLDSILMALADPVRRDILERIRTVELSVNQIAIEYDISLAAVSKHLKVLASANLITRRRQGKFIFVRTNVATLDILDQYLDSYRQ